MAPTISQSFASSVPATGSATPRAVTVMNYGMEMTAVSTTAHLAMVL